MYINDSSLNLKPSVDETGRVQRERQIALRFFLEAVDPILRERFDSIAPNISVTASTALFGGDLNAQPVEKPLRFGYDEESRVVQLADDINGCSPINRVYDGDVVLVQRGECTFLEKLIHARNAGASGVVVISDGDLEFNPSADARELESAGDIEDVALVLITKSDGDLVTRMMRTAGEGAEVIVSVEFGHL